MDFMGASRARLSAYGGVSIMEWEVKKKAAVYGRGHM